MPTGPSGVGSGAGRLFDAEVVAQYLAEKKSEPIPELDVRFKALHAWVDGLAKHTKGKGETALEQKFNQDVLVGVLGYRLLPDPAATAYPKPPSALTNISTIPDVALGHFPAANDTEHVIYGVLELKKPGTPLDLPQSNKEDHKTPVDQAFGYGTTILNTRWVLVSDMQVIRLYAVENDLGYEAFDLRECVLGGPDGDAFRRLYFLLGHSALIAHGSGSTVSSLFTKSAQAWLRAREKFYDVYYEIRADLYGAVTNAAAALTPARSKDEVLQGVQRLLDRALFIYYCEDHPDHLIPNDTVANVTAAARVLPGPSTHKAYDQVKLLFREIDAGSPAGSALSLAGYNGELFKDHWIDHIDLPDALNDKTYFVRDDAGKVVRTIRGVWGLHEYDFWTELNEHLLGHIFEQSLSDLVSLKSGGAASLSQKLAERKKHGVFYTDELLAEFATSSVLKAVIAQVAATTPVPGSADEAAHSALEARLNAIMQLRLIDLACGSGAFLVSALRELLREYWRIRDASGALKKQSQLDLTEHTHQKTQATLLKNCLYGVDLLPQAVEIAKLALWLRSARKSEKVADLGTNLTASNTLDFQATLARIKSNPGSFDVVVGNPPWGGHMSVDDKKHASAFLGVDPSENWDTWELFVLLGLAALKPGGRLAMILPDTLLSPEKQRTRRRLLDATQIDKLHNLGPDWFGADVRMGTLFLQATKGQPMIAADFRSMILTGDLRRRAIRGEVPLTQLEAQLSGSVPQGRCAASDDAEIRLFQTGADDVIVGKMNAHSVLLENFCERARGEEMSKTGLVWTCPSCSRPTTPGKKDKEKSYKPKDCPSCGLELTTANAVTSYIVQHTPFPGSVVSAPFIDGDDISRRYGLIPPSKYLRLDLPEWDYKDASVFKGPKALIRQAGVGLYATLDYDDARCPQSVYLYRVKPEYVAQGYTHEYLLGVLLSRTMTYYVFKAFGEVDPSRAHVKVTHERLALLPIPKVDFSNAQQRALHDEIAQDVKALLSGAAKPDEKEDRDVERAVRELWGLSAQDGQHITGEFARVPPSQIISDLFPNGIPVVPGLVVKAASPPATGTTPAHLPATMKQQKPAKAKPYPGT